MTLWLIVNEVRMETPAIVDATKPLRLVVDEILRDLSVTASGSSPTI